MVVASIRRLLDIGGESAAGEQQQSELRGAWVLAVHDFADVGELIQSGDVPGGAAPFGSPGRDHALRDVTSLL